MLYPFGSRASGFLPLVGDIHVIGRFYGQTRVLAGLPLQLFAALADFVLMLVTTMQ